MLFAGNMVRQPCFDGDAHGRAKPRLADAGYRVAGDLAATDRIMNDAFWVGVYPGLSDEMLTYMACADHRRVRGSPAVSEALPTSEHRIGARRLPARSCGRRGPAPPIVLTSSSSSSGRAVSIAYHYVMGVYLGSGYRWSTFLFIPKDHFMDYFNVYRHAQEFRPGESTNMVYSPLLHFVMTVLNAIPAWVGFVRWSRPFRDVRALLWSWTMRLSRTRRANRVRARRWSLLCYPVLIALDRGNLEMLVFVMLAAFFYVVLRGDGRPGPGSPCRSRSRRSTTGSRSSCCCSLTDRIRQAAGVCSGPWLSRWLGSSWPPLSGYGVAGVVEGSAHTLVRTRRSRSASWSPPTATASGVGSSCIHRWSDDLSTGLPLQRIYLLGAI